MKVLVLFAASLCLQASVSFAETYSFKHPVSMSGYTEEECKAENLEWNSEGYCVINDVADTVVIAKPKKYYKVNVETITTNAHQCSFEATNGKLVNSRKLVSSQPSTIYKDNKPIASKCVVTVNYNDNNSVSVTTNGYEECAEFCGANASLEIEKAIKE